MTTTDRPIGLTPGMRTIDGWEFPDPDSPDCAEAIEEWRCQQVRVMLHRKVMVVARTRIEGEWKAYCFPVRGENHDQEEFNWREEGAQLHEDYARPMFPKFSEVPYAR